MQPEFYDNELLDAIRPWMTLDSDPADHQRLNEQLEAWSLFPIDQYLFVVRLVPAGTYDRRAAYFAHARAWKREALSTPFDPGLYLGRSDTFDQPWRDETPVHATEVPPSLVRRAQISTETETAAYFLGHLFQALVEGYPLIIAAPIADFVSGSPLHALVSLARAGLPASRRQQCRIRVYSRSPDLFLSHLAADLVVIPEDVAGGALMAAPNATLLDRQGRKVVGKELDKRALDYASAVVERAIGIPDGLPYFSKRFQDRFGQDLPSPADARGVQITYNLAFALAGPKERRGELLRRYVPRAAEKLGPGLNWNRLIRADEWQEFPREALLDQLLESADVGEGGTEFMRALEKEASQLALRVDERLPEWWSPRDPRKVRRLVELLAHHPPLVSEGEAAVRTADVPIDRLPQERLAAVLRAEANRGLLSRRAHESAALALRARNREMFEVLTQAVSDDRLEPSWARIYVQKAPANEVVEQALVWLEDSDFWLKWDDVPERLLERLRHLERPAVNLATLLKGSGHGLDPVSNLELYVLMAEVLTRIDPADGDALMARLWRELPRLNDQQRQTLEDMAFDPEWRCIEISRIDLPTLLNFATGFRKKESDDRLYEALDERMRRNPEATTAILVRDDWWYFWRLRSRLDRANLNDEEVLRRSAFAWLGADVWTGRTAKEATLEAWEKAVADLPQVLSGRDLAGLRDPATGRRRWPWIPPFEEDQVIDLIRRASDLGALAELAEAASDWSPSDGTPIHEYMLQMPALHDALPASSLGWLMKGEGRSRPYLNDEQSAYLYRNAGHRIEQALLARIRFVAAHLKRDPAHALMVAGNPDLWVDQRFLSEIANWMNGRASLSEIGTENAKWIDEHATIEPENAPKSPSEALVRELVDHGFNNAARLLNPKFQREVEMQRLIGNVIAALTEGRANDSSWRGFAQMVRSFEMNRQLQGKHPLAELAQRIREDLPRDVTSNLARNGWRTFEDAAAENAGLILPLLTPPDSGAKMLPLLDLAASMLRPGALGLAAVQLAFSISNPSWREDMRLWQSLLRAVRDFRRHGDVASADDRQNMAVAVMDGALDRPRERNALIRALKQEVPTGWRAALEFGENTL